MNNLPWNITSLPHNHHMTDHSLCQLTRSISLSFFRLQFRTGIWGNVRDEWRVWCCPDVPNNWGPDVICSLLFPSSVLFLCTGILFFIFTVLVFHADFRLQVIFALHVSDIMLTKPANRTWRVEAAWKLFGSVFWAEYRISKTSLSFRATTSTWGGGGNVCDVAYGG